MRFGSFNTLSILSLSNLIPDKYLRNCDLILESRDPIVLIVNSLNRYLLSPTPNSGRLIRSPGEVNKTIFTFCNTSSRMVLFNLIPSESLCDIGSFGDSPVAIIQILTLINRRTKYYSHSLSSLSKGLSARRLLNAHLIGTPSKLKSINSLNSFAMSNLKS